MSPRVEASHLPDHSCQTPPQAFVLRAINNGRPTEGTGLKTGRKTMTAPSSEKASTRRRFLKTAAASAAAAVAAPTIVSAQGPVSMRWQSTWPSKDIFHEYAL